MKYVIDKSTGSLIEKNKQPRVAIKILPVQDWWVEYQLLMEDVGAIMRGEAFAG